MAVNPIKKLGFNKIYSGDARILAPRLADESITATITSPPYWGLKNYGGKHQIGWAQDYSEYLNDLVLIFRHVHRATVPSGSLWIVLDTLKQNGKLRLLPFEVAERLQNEIGWLLQDVIVWDKGKTLPWSRAGQMRNQFEYLLCFSKTRTIKYEIDRLKEIELKEWWVKYPERYNPRGKVPSNIWTLPIPVQGSWSSNGLRHACPFPIPLVERVLLLTTDPSQDNIVFDPFAGSGIVLALAEQMKRGFLGFELNPRFVAMYRTTVRRFVKKEWASRSEQVDTLEGKRKALQDQIFRLRLTKYPKSLLKKLTEAMEKELPIFRGILALGPKLPSNIMSHPKRHHMLSLQVILVVEESINRTAVNNAIQQVISKPPLSKFGINARIVLVTLRDVQEFGNFQARFGVSHDEVLWLYRHERTYKFQAETTVRQWLEAIKSQYSTPKESSCLPMIASNVPVCQKIERTWFPKQNNITVRGHASAYEVI
jgi:DNA modification methylase